MPGCFENGPSAGGVRGFGVTMNLKRAMILTAVLAGVAVYVVMFYATRLAGVPDGQGHAMSRGMLTGIYLLRPDDLMREWFGTPLGFAVVDRLPVLAIAGGIVGVATALGWLLLVLVRVALDGSVRGGVFLRFRKRNTRYDNAECAPVGAQRGLTRVERFVFSAAVGLNAVSTYVLAVGLAGWLDRVAVFVVPGVGVVAAAVGVWWWRVRGESSGALGEGTREGERKMSSPPAALPRGGEGRKRAVSHSGDSGREGEGKGDWLGARWLWLAVPFAVVIVLGGMLPPFEFDVREYHLQVPKEFFQQGRITFLAHNAYGNMAMGAEMLSLLAMVLTKSWWLGALAGKTIIAGFAPLTALGLWAAGRRLVSSTAGVVAAVVFLSTGWIVEVSTFGLVDGAAACYLFLALYAALLWARSGGDGADSNSKRDGSRLVLAGYLVGGAVATKYPAALFVAVPITLWVVWQQVGSGWSLSWKRVTAFVLAMVAGCGLWFGKNWVLTGNPTYPLLYEVFGGESWTAEKNAQWNRAHRPHDFSAATLGRDLERVGLTSPWLNVLLVPLAVLALVNRRHRRLAWLLAGYFAYVVAVWWLLTHRIDRFWVPAIPLLALLAGIGAVWTSEGVWRRVLVGMLICGCVANFVVVASPVVGDNRYFVGLERLRSDPQRVDAWQRYYNEHGVKGRLLLVGEAQVFDLEPPLAYNTCFDSCIFEELVKGRSPEQIRKALAAAGITDVYVNWGEIARYRSPGNYGFTDFVQPEVFQRLVDQGVLEPLPEIEGSSGRGYRVVPK